MYIYIYTSQEAVPKNRNLEKKKAFQENNFPGKLIAVTIYSVQPSSFQGCKYKLEQL